VHALAVVPVTPSTLYAGTDGGLFKSMQGYVLHLPLIVRGP